MEARLRLLFREMPAMDSKIKIYKQVVFFA
jgi:hypothetical protein